MSVKCANSIHVYTYLKAIKHGMTGLEGHFSVFNLQIQTYNEGFLPIINSKCLICYWQVA